ncbi:hypothetical protein RJ640_026922 [Escallonia rubra]|uniref:Uncharacterized protein n=1 Tax=Escallonia rubra TaxID=112253 RepID=A0AA88UBL3_9ASTE|nr:hypothetical protein RJ640_026922 [Escallonia rubra]
MLSRSCRLLTQFVAFAVCPTTLKRICRQHGITRWPSRKIKKVGHSLKKLQLVIDSVQGAEGAIQLSSFYTNFPQLSSPSLTTASPFSSAKMKDHMEQLNTRSEGSLLSSAMTSLKSQPSSFSHSSNSSLSRSTGPKQLSATVNASSKGDVLTAEQAAGVLKRAYSGVGFHDLCQEETKFLIRPHSRNLFTEHPSSEALPSLPKSSSQVLADGGAFRVKATFGEEKVRFRIPRHWGFEELRGEIVRRFNAEGISKIDLKYLDDDSEWVLLTCDADLEECIDIYRSSSTHTIKLSLHQNLYSDLGSSFGSNGPS